MPLGGGSACLTSPFMGDGTAKAGVEDLMLPCPHHQSRGEVAQLARSKHGTDQSQQAKCPLLSLCLERTFAADLRHSRCMAVLPTIPRACFRSDSTTCAASQCMRGPQRMLQAQSAAATKQPGQGSPAFPPPRVASA